MQNSQALITLFGIPDSVAQREGQMFVSFGGLTIFLGAVQSLPAGAMKIEAALDSGSWTAQTFSVVAHIAAPTEKVMPPNAQSAAPPGGARIEHAESGSTPAANAVRPPQAKSTPTATAGSAFSGLVRTRPGMPVSARRPEAEGTEARVAATARPAFDPNAGPLDDIPF